MASQSFTISSQNATSWNLIRDNNGRITRKTETIAGSTSVYDYAYDATGRLLTVTRNSTLVERYQYDLKGARNFEMNSLRGISGRSFTYSDEDHLFTAGSVSYNYDVDGFLISRTEGSATTQYNYSQRGELLGVTLPNNSQIEYIHDPLGRRIAKKVNGAIVEKYLWHGLTNLLAVYDGSNNLLMRFQYTDARMPVAMTKAGSTYYLTYDQVGSLRAVADSSGNVVKRIDYDSFGNIIADSNPSFTVPFGFAGGLHDRDTGLVRFGFRDYDPDIGRWTAKDPIGFDGGDTDLYGYVLSDPVNAVDPNGLLVRVGQHPAFVNSPRNPFNHAAIVLSPDNPKDFADNPLFRNNNTATLGGQAFGPGFNNFFAWFGGLQGAPNFPGDSPNKLSDLTVVCTPSGMSDTDFINALLNAAARYNNDAIYDPLPASGPYGILGYNSNSYVSGVIIAAGGVPPNLPGSRPGYNIPLPIP